MKIDFNPENGVILAYDYFHTKHDLLNQQNWTDIVGGFLKIIPRRVHSDLSKRILCGWLATLCEKSYYEVVHLNHETPGDSFKKELMRLVQKEVLPEYLTQSGPVLCGKKQPSFIESILPTLNRYEVMELVSKRFNVGVKSFIVGGSMSYGPFYSVRGDGDTGEVSDIDGIIVFDDEFFGFEQTILADEVFIPEEMSLFVKRLKLFRQLFKDGKADLLSQRFSIKGKDFTVSLHFFPISVFADITTGLIVEAIKERKDTEHILKDFRVNPFTHPCMATNSFMATRRESVVTGYAVDGGYISHMPGYAISRGVLFLGAYHTVIYPAFLLFYNKDTIVSECVGKFEKLLYSEVEKLRLKYPFASYNKGHNRYDIFAPGRYEEGNNSFLHPKHLEKYEIPASQEIFLTLDESGLKLKHGRPSTLSTHRKLIKWRHETLASVEREIKKFRKNRQSPLLLKSLKEKGISWHTICTFPSTQKRIRFPKKNTLQTDKTTLILAILEQENILPNDVLRLTEYNQLAKDFGRVFISSSYDATDPDRRYPIFLSLIIRT
jgi:hypothetical protein